MERLIDQYQKELDKINKLTRGIYNFTTLECGKNIEVVGELYTKDRVRSKTSAMDMTMNFIQGDVRNVAGFVVYNLMTNLAGELIKEALNEQNEKV